MKRMLDETLRSVLVRKALSVHCAAIDYFDDQPFRNHGKIHEAERGVELILETGEIIRVSWDDYENDYGVNLARKEVSNFWNEAVMRNVTERGGVDTFNRSGNQGNQSIPAWTG